MKIVVMGSGGLGGYLGFRLSQAGNEVHFIARGDRLKAMQDNGLRLITNEEDTSIKVEATDDLSSIGSVEFVLFCVKTYDTQTATKAILPALNARDSSILTLQNGVENFEIISNIVGYERVLAGGALIASELLSPGILRVSTKVRKVVFGEMSGKKTDRVEKIYQIFKEAGIDCEVTNEVAKFLWRKMVWICGMAGMTSLTRLPIGKIMSYPETREMFELTIREVTHVAKAKNVDIGGEEFVKSQVDFADHLEKDATSSMMRDLVAGRKLELDALNGTIVRIGRENGIPTPMNQAIYSALKPYSKGSLPPPNS